jgi:transposase
VVHGDDTGMRVVKLTRPPEDERTGVFTTGVASVVGDRQIALYFTGRQHAGENLADVLKQRAGELPLPVLMCDASASNTSELDEGAEMLLARCLAHGRRKIVSVAGSFPEQCLHVLVELGKVYKVDAAAKERKLTPFQRLQWHQEQSQPVMDELEKWMNRQFAERLVEPNSGLGKAITYLQRHWKGLTLFLRQQGAPLDNNLVERVLKKAVLHRNYVYPAITRRWTNHGRSGLLRPSFRRSRTAHNHNASRKASRRSLGRYCRDFEAGIVILSIARFFMVKSASTYMCVVAVLS